MENREARIAARKRQRRKENMKTLCAMVALITLFGLIFSIVADAFEHPELHLDKARYQLMMELNNGENIEYYKDNYINENIYLYNGDVTLSLMAEQFDIDFDILKSFYASSNVKSLQKLYDKYLKHEDVVESLQRL